MSGPRLPDHRGKKNDTDASSSRKTSKHSSVVQYPAKEQELPPPPQYPTDEESPHTSNREFTAGRGGGGGGGDRALSYMSSVNQLAPILHTDEWPFGYGQPDVARETLLGQDRDNALRDRKNVPSLNNESYKQVALNAEIPIARELQSWDEECLAKHLDAINGSAISLEELQDLCLMNNESVVQVMDLAGVVNAPGLLTDVTQRCRLTLTDKNRLIFTQANHSAEVGVPQMGCCFALVQCCHDRWSTRKWTSFFASINASEVLDVFVQQSLTTSYTASDCNCKTTCESLCCTVGGTLMSQKNMDGMTQTLADHDQRSGCTQKWVKTRYMRHSLVIRYIDTSNNRVEQVIAMADPDVPSTYLYQLARSVNEARTITSKEWLLAKRVPTPGGFGEFSNESPIPLLKRGSYKAVVAVLLVLGFLFLIGSVVGGIFMILGVLIMLGGSFRQLAKSTVASYAPSVSKSLSYTLYGGGVLYSLGFLIAIVDISR